MIHIKPFIYEPTDNERERASNSYLMSLVAIIAGLPLPILNLLATLLFYFSNRKATYFVRWHCMQALLSQLSVLVVNSIAFWWTISLLFGEGEMTNAYISYLIIAIIFNLIEFITTIYTTIKVRKVIHVTWWFYGTLADRICSEYIGNEEIGGSKYGW